MSLAEYIKKISKRIFYIWIFVSLIFSNQTYSQKIIENTNNQFNSVEDYQVNMLVELDVPAFRMPKKKYKVFYKNPNKIKVKAKGFGILPKTGLFTSPNDNFDNLKDIEISMMLFISL